jgi:choline dehydrogenase-like flavoprotein
VAESETDVAIVGAGAGGLAAAWRLSTRGVRVTLLEAGRRFEAARDYPQTSPDFESRPFPYDAVRDARGRPRHTFGREQPIESSWADYCSRTVGAPFRRPIRRRYLEYAHVRGVGGSTLHFQGEAHRFHPDSLRMRTLFGVGADWPLAYAELERYYELAEAEIGVAAPVNPLRPQARPPGLPPHPLSYASRRLVPAFEAVGARLLPNALAILPRVFRGRPPCNYCNACSAGCPIGDKGSADVTFLPPALATNRLELLTEAEALRIETDGQGRVDSIVYADGQRRVQRLRVRAVVLAAGAVETPRLLLLSESSRFPRGLANSNGHVGRHLTETLFWLTTALHPERLDSFRGIPIDGSAWEFSVPQMTADQGGGFRLMTAHGAAGLRGPASYARLLPGFGVEHQRRVAQAFGRGVAVGAVGEWLPNPHTRVDLDPVARDDHGRPRARITSWLGDAERRLLKRMADTVRAVVAAAGAEPVSERGTLDQFAATHVLGTCRMGTDSAQSVADPGGISHEVPNLAFADGSLLPSSGSGDSPFLTITALAIRTADNLLVRAGRS